MKTHERYLPPHDVDGAKEKFAALTRTHFDGFAKQALTEADTRAKIIDAIVKDVLMWPETHIEREPHIRETGGFIDYLLSTSHPYFVIEAKSVGRLYAIPDQKTRRRYKVSGVLAEDKDLSADLMQAKSYAINKGVSFCCLTNGIQFLFFRSQNDSGIPWGDHAVIVFRDHEDIAQNFGLFFHLLAYESVSQGIVHAHLPITQNYAEELRRFSRLSRLEGVARTRERNALFPSLRVVISRVFQDIYDESATTEILEHCYVESPRDSSYGRGMEGLLRRRPLEIGHSRTAVVVSKKDAGAFQKSVLSQIRSVDGEPEVLLMLGGVGVGKTTFIHRFRNVLARDDIDVSCLWAYVDFNKYSDTGETLLSWYVKQAWESLKTDYESLGIDSYAALKQAYHSEYEQLKRGRLAPLFERAPAEFELEFGKSLEAKELISDEHFIRMMRVAAKRLDRRTFLVFDNADQFPESTQDQVFRLAQRFAKEIRCASLISLREESYWKNKDHGTLSAFHAMSYHVYPPKLEQVVAKRFRFAQKLLSEIEIDFVSTKQELVTREELAGVLDKVAQLLLSERSPFLELLECLSPFEIRRPLQFLARFLISGHTNMDSLLTSHRRGSDITIGFHEFFTSIALGDQESYAETRSDIVNMFAVEGRADASNLNRIGVIGRLLSAKRASTPVGEGFLPVTDLVNDCESLGIFPDTTRSILALLNNKRIVETEAQDRHTLGTATFVRATAAAQYYMSKLIYDFGYLDTVLVDTAVGSEPHFDKIEALTKEIHATSKNTGPERLKRVQLRLERAKRFQTYLLEEFENSTLRKQLNKVDPIVRRYFESAQGKLLRQSHDVEKNAKRVFT